MSQNIGLQLHNIINVIVSNIFVVCQQYIIINFSLYIRMLYFILYAVKIVHTFSHIII